MLEEKYSHWYNFCSVLFYVLGRNSLVSIEFLGVLFYMLEEFWDELSGDWLFYTPAYLLDEVLSSSDKRNQMKSL